MAERRRLLLTTELFAPGGVQRLGRESISALAADLAPLDVWSLTDAEVPAGYQRSANVELHLAADSALTLGAWSLSRAMQRSDDLDLLVMHIHLAPIALPMMMRGARAALFLLGVEVWRPLTRIERMFVERCDRLIAISRFTADRFRRINPWCAERTIDVCPLGVAGAPPGLAGEQNSDDDGTALIVSRLDPADRYKGHEALIRAWPAVRSLCPRATLVIAGDGDDRGRLEEISHSLGLADAVRFPGRLDDGQLGELYRRCAFFVMPSRDEGFGLAFLEAMRAGKPCIAARGAAEEIVIDGVTGTILTSTEEGVLVDAMVRLFENRPLRQSMGQSGRRRFEQMFTSDHFADRLRHVVSDRRASKGEAA